MRILIALTYYRPHVSGLTIYAQRLARALVRRGHAVTILTSGFAPQLPVRERTGDGVEVVRVPIASKVSKGVIMPLFPFYAGALARRHDVINVHLPQFEAALLAGIGRAAHRGVVLTYQCDLKMPHGWFNRFVERSLVPLNEAAARLAHAVVATSADYAANSPLLTRHQAKLTVIPTLIDLAPATEPGRARLRHHARLDDSVCIGFAARFAAEKGVEYLLAALPRIVAAFPNLRILFTGAYQYTVGEETYATRLEPLIAAQRERLVFFDLLPDEDMPNFFSLCDVLAVTSLNSTESFGLVQVEAMLCGTPVVATDIPGVREAVRRTGMGRIVPPHDASALADALIDVIRHRAHYQRPREAITAEFNLDAAVSQYEALFERCAGA